MKDNRIINKLFLKVNRDIYQTISSLFVKAKQEIFRYGFIVQPSQQKSGIFLQSYNQQIRLRQVASHET